MCWSALGSGPRGRPGTAADALPPGPGGGAHRVAAVSEGFSLALWAVIAPIRPAAACGGLGTRALTRGAAREWREGLRELSGRLDGMQAR